MPENPRIEELRRRVQADSASIAFAALAEEYRRLGRYEEAVDTCLAGLQRHPAYLSARVTLGRALIETGELDSAREQFEMVLQSAPENIAATRGLAQIHERLGHSTVMDPHLAQLMREHVDSMPPAPSIVEPPSAPSIVEPPPAPSAVEPPLPAVGPIHFEPEPVEAAPTLLEPLEPQFTPPADPPEVKDLPVASLAAVPFGEPEADNRVDGPEFPELPQPPERPERPDLPERQEFQELRELPESQTPRELPAFHEPRELQELRQSRELPELREPQELSGFSGLSGLSEFSERSERSAISELPPLELPELPPADVAAAISSLERLLAAIQHARHA
jgi:hypothetical protein